ncbi:MAG: asparaginase domain-containing protein [Desulfobacteraceae bacterium]|nr:asparaginase domain-containing protein [Desulfobacteraceae bacterium]
MKIKFFTTGGTIDKIYFDDLSEYKIGDPKVETILRDARINFDYEIQPLFRKDSLDMTDKDRIAILNAVNNDKNRFIVITHGTDTMIKTANALKKIKNKVIVLTGAMEPAAFKSSDAFFNLGGATAAVQVLENGVYIAINGRVYNPDKIKKNRDLLQFIEK